jgi:hypothetical protein
MNQIDQFLSMKKDYISMFYLFFVILMNYLFKKDISYDNNNIILLKMMLE